jgi:hypothetical protein
VKLKSAPFSWYESPLHVAIRKMFCMGKYITIKPNPTQLGVFDLTFPVLTFEQRLELQKRDEP